MSRSGYTDDCDDQLALGRWRAQVASAMRGARGQQFFRDLVAALDAMPEKRLITEELETDGCVCTLGALGRHRGVDITQLDVHDHDQLGTAFNIARQLAQETMWENDECGIGKYVFNKYVPETPEERWQRMRKWAESNLRSPEGKEVKP